MLTLLHIRFVLKYLDLCGKKEQFFCGKRENHNTNNRIKQKSNGKQWKGVRNICKMKTERCKVFAF